MSKDKSIIAELNEQQHEDLCRRCGRCCFLKIPFKSKMHVTPFPCRHLDIKNKTCKVYDERFKEHARCQNIEDGLKVSAFPEDCPYTKFDENYVPPVEKWDNDTIDFFVSKLKKLMPGIKSEVENFAKKHPNSFFSILDKQGENISEEDWEVIADELRKLLQKDPYYRLGQGWD